MPQDRRYTNPELYAFENSIQEIIDERLNPLLDDLSHTQKAIDYAHHEIHDGNSYLFQEGISLNNTTQTYIIQTPDNNIEPHMVISIAGAQDTFISFDENTALNGEDLVTIINRNRRSSNEAQTKIWKGVGAGNDASDLTRMFSARWGIAAAANGRGASGGDHIQRAELMLKRDTRYKLIIQALSANNNNITVSFDWYEH